MPDHPGDRLLAELARDRGPDLTSYAYLLAGDLAAAQDLVQDAFVKVFVRTRAGFTPDSAEAYVRRTILTLFLDGYRRRRHWTAVRHLLADPDRADGPAATSADRLDLRAALHRLAPQERAAIVRRYYEDLTVPEVADQMGLAGGTVKRYLSNAVHKLETYLGPMPSLRDGEETVVARSSDPTTRRG